MPLFFLQFTGIIPERNACRERKNISQASEYWRRKSNQFRTKRILRNKLGMVKERIICILNLENKTLCYTAATCIIY